MNRRVGLATVLTAAVLLLLPGSASAAGNGSTSKTMSGVPSSLPVGGSFTVTMTVRSTSQYRINVMGFYLSMWNTAQESTKQDTGISVLWNDPATGGWRASDHADATGGWALYERERVLFIEPHGSMTVQAKVTLGPDAARGTMHLMGTGLTSYALMTPSGEYVSGVLDNLGTPPQTTFRYGSSAPAPTPAATSRSAEPKPTPTHSATRSATSGAADASATPQAETPSSAAVGASAEPTPSASPSVTVSASDSPSPVASTVPVASSRGTGGSRWLLLGGLVALVAAGGAIVALLVHRARQNRDGAAGTE
ncbi:hypothetical protein [Kitasatospora paracochleata]|uniref:Uncharacterized protein n=1 Tax=Kitasatospora paracochleata TaxID=58354 RepID=A0ABT1J0L8_9ACTN|nr:hypothetical protein [Kitasatospora paracochleata]MCP2310942.1 hypothetical protein [Kitasatospora paracochleata]